MDNSTKLQSILKFCVIGCGNIATNCHGPSYIAYQKQNPDLELTACCDIDAESAKNFKEQFGFLRYYTNFANMLQKEKPDAVAILISEQRIAEVAIKVMDMGFPVFTEKPPGKTLLETKALAEAAARNEVINHVGYNRRGIPILQKLKGMINESKENKTIQFLRYDLFRTNRFDEDFSDTAVHGIDAVRYLTDADYKKVHFTYQPLPEYGKNVRNIYMDCIMTSGVHTQLSFCPVAGIVIERAMVNAKDNTWIANIPIWGYGFDQPGELTHIRDNKTVKKISGTELCEINEVQFTNGFYYEVKEFLDNVKKGKQSTIGFKESLNTNLIKDCITSNATKFDAP